MNRYFNMKNFYTFLFIFSIYTLFAILFGDILRGKEFNIELKNIPFLIVSILFFAWINKYFFNNTSINLPKVKIIIILITSIILSLSLQKVIKINEASYSGKKKFQNPLYKKFVKIANKNNLDLSFTKTVWIQRGPVNYKINTIFKEKAKSIDILFFGDSSIAWGMIPKVIEQMTGKRVAMYAYESNLLTVKTSKLFNKIAKFYLKDNGIVIYSFDNWTKEKAPDSVKISKKQCDEIINWEDQDFSEYATKYATKSSAKSEKSFYDKYLSFNSFQSLYNEKSEDLKSKYGLYLKSSSFYEDYIEAIVNPTLHKNKSKNKNKKIKFIRWDMDSITEYKPHFRKKSIYSNVMPKQPMINKNVQLNAEAASKIYGNTKIYMVPIYSNQSSYKKSRNMYFSYYKDLGFQLCDLGQFHPKKAGYTIQAGPHTGNTGGLMKSILIGKWLKKYFKHAR